MATNTSQPDNLVGDLPVETLRIALDTGVSVVRGQVVGFNTSTKKIGAYDSTGSNGLNAFYGIAHEDADQSEGDTYVTVYVFGKFNISELTFANTADSATQTLINSARALGCLLKTFVGY